MKCAQDLKLDKLSAVRVPIRNAFVESRNI